MQPLQALRIRGKMIVVGQIEAAAVAANQALTGTDNTTTETHPFLERNPVRLRLQPVAFPCGVYKIKRQVQGRRGLHFTALRINRPGSTDVRQRHQYTAVTDINQVGVLRLNKHSHRRDVTGAPIQWP